MRPIGVFDSGVGGLVVVRELIRQLPSEDIIYFGDTARVPYGIKSKETVIRFSLENILFLLKEKVKLICVACNTVSSVALPVIKNYFRVPMVDVITPAVREAVYACQNKHIGVIGTKGTIESRTYENEIRQLDSTIKVTSVSCPLFVPFAEEGWLSGNVVLEVAREYLKTLKEDRVDVVILGCTHYPLLKSVIKEALGRNVRLIDSAQQVAIEVKRILVNENLLSSTQRGKHRFYVSDNPQGFKNLAERFLGQTIDKVRKVK